MLVELKNGETYNGHLVSCDSWMNLNLREVICTSRDGMRFFQLRECYVRGNTIKYLRIPDEVLEKVKDDDAYTRKDKGISRGRGRGGKGVTPRGGKGGKGRGRGRGRGKGKGGGD